MECKLAPYGINWDNNKGYLIGKDLKEEKIINYRLDRIEKLKITEKDIKIPDEFNLEEYTAKCWKMFFGDLINIELRFENSLLPLVKDKFEPKYYEIINRNENYFTIKTEIRGIDGLKIWLLSLGSKVKVIKPNFLKEEIKKEAKKIINLY